VERLAPTIGKRVEAAAGWVIETHDGLARRLRTFVDVKAARDLYEVLAAGVPRFE
jgi:hypothetical protein